MKICISIIMLVLSANSFSAVISTTGTDVKIKSIYTYHKDLPYGGQIIVKTMSPVTSCEDGFWISKEDLEANSNIAAYLLSAFHSGSTVYFAADNGLRWPHNSSKAYCKVNTVYPVVGQARHRRGLI